MCVCSVTQSCSILCDFMDLPGNPSGKEPACNIGDARDKGSIPGLGRSPGGGHGNPLQYSWLENPTERETWWTTVHRVAKSKAGLKQPSTYAPIATSQTPLSMGFSR